jgi:hypothetical protein
METRKMLYDTQHVKFYIDESIPCLVNEWQGFIKSELFREYILKLVDLLKEHHSKYGHLNMLADTRELRILPPKDIEWVNQHINPLYIENGASFEAFLLPKDEYGGMSINRYIRQTTKHGDFIVQMFDSLDNAKAWLKSVYQESTLSSPKIVE